jgi:hypothetical protein
MEWEEALLIARGGESPPHPATYYRRQAARARQVAAEVTTPAMRLRLLNEAVHCDELAAKADRIAEEAAGKPPLFMAGLDHVLLGYRAKTDEA